MYNNWTKLPVARKLAVRHTKLVSLSLNLDFVNNWIHCDLFEFGMRLCIKYSTVNNFNKPTLIYSLHAE